jgi:hypothetical protein
VSMNGSPQNPRRLLGLAIAALLVAAGMWLVYRSSTDDPVVAPTPDPTATTGAVVADTTATTAAVSLDAGRVAELVAFVEATRNLTFTEEPEVEIMAADEFGAELAGFLDTELDSSAITESEDVYRALALSPTDQEIEPLLREFLLRRTLGYYDNESATVRVRGGLGPLTESVLVHELTHALESEYFDLDSDRFSEREDESLLAFQAVVEGNAAFVEAAFVEQLSEAEKTERQLGQAGLVAPPPLSGPVLVTLAFPYSEGSVYVDGLFAAGGTDMLDLALTNPPRTSEQISEGQAIGLEDAVSEVRFPPADDVEMSRGVLGSLTLRLVLETALPRANARELSLEWSGDAFVSWREQTAVCVRADIVAESPAAQERMLIALTEVAKARVGTADVVAVDDLVRFTSCA